MKKDMLFSSKIFEDGGFVFNQSVVDVFDDMVSRSVPHYLELQHVLVKVVLQKFSHKDEIKVFDLGCSTGTLGHVFSEMMEHTKSQISYVGVDNSSEMLSVFKKRVRSQQRFFASCVKADLNQPFNVEMADVVVCNLVLQFLQIGNRKKVLQSICDGLSFQGVCCVIEKIKMGAACDQQLFTSIYHGLKKDNGYSSIEINNKAEALDGVLEPLTYEENLKLLREAGFSRVVPFFQWFNFVGFLAFK